MSRLPRHCDSDLSVTASVTGPYRVSGLDISRTFVQLANDRARELGLAVDFRQGDVADMPFDAGSFDLIVCQAAFKNFTRPVRALDEMYRVLRYGGTAVIQDMSREATRDDIDREVHRMRLGRVNAIMVRTTLSGLRRALSAVDVERFVAESTFGTGDVRADGIGLEVRLRKN